MACDSGSQLSANLEARIGVLIRLEPGDGPQGPYRSDSCRLRQSGWLTHREMRRVSKTRGALTGMWIKTDSHPPIWRSKRAGSRTRLETAGCPQGHGLRVFTSPPIRVGPRGRYRSPKPRSRVRLLTGPPFTDRTTAVPWALNSMIYVRIVVRDPFRLVSIYGDAASLYLAEQRSSR